MLKEMIKETTGIECNDIDDLDYILQDAVDAGNGFMLVQPNLMVVRYIEQAFKKNIRCNTDGE